MPEHTDPALVKRLCEQASKENNAERLLELVKRITDELDKESEAKRASRKSA